MKSIKINKRNKENRNEEIMKKIKRNYILFY